VGGNITENYWSFGDGTSSMEDNPVHSYDGGGDKTISLVVTDDLSCKDSTEQSIFITPDFTLDINYFGLCNNTPTHLSGEVRHPTGLTPDTWNWLFDDGSTATGQNTVYTFDAGGDHSVFLSASKNGCEENYTEVLRVNPAPTASFQYSLVSLDDTVQFIDASSLNGGPAITAWDWTFDDPMSGLANHSSAQNPQHLFTHLGDFDVTLTVTDANGCSDDTTMTLTVNPRPVAGFSWDNSCFGTDVQFSDTSTTSQGFITDWWWNFDDPSSGAFNESTAQNPTHAFTAPGTYDVQLVVKAYGYDTIIHQVTVHQGATAAYSYNNPCQGEAVNFVDETVIGDAPITSWLWDFADSQTSTLQNPSHNYQFSGNYLVDLTVTDTNGCQNTITHNVTIWQGPTAKFNYHSACTGSLTYFIDKTIADGADIVAWDWSFGDPGSGGDNFSQEQNPSHAYSSEGIYQVILIAEDAHGCTDSDTVNIIVEPAPVADFTADSVCIGQAMSFIDQSYSNGQPIISWYWEFGDGATSTSANPSHTYATAGAYDVLLVVETAGQCSSEIVKTVQVHYLPTANFEWQGGIACENDSTHFTDLSQPTGNATINAWFWQFGDGTTSDIQHPDHYYAASGNYAVSLQVTDIYGCQSSISQTVSVSDAPVSNFIYDNSDCDTVSFTSTGYDPNGLNITSWYWNFDDPASGVNNVSTDQNPIHQYVNGGIYSVMHIITNESGCSDTLYQDISISKPQAEYSYTSNCANFPVNFSDESTATGDPVIAWAWDFNDGTSTTLSNPSHIFTSGGSYLVSLTVTTAGGCSSQIAHVVEVNYGPTTNFIHTSLHCTSDSIQFTDVSTGNATLMTWEWQFGDGTTSDIPNPKHAYATSGTYLVNLRVTDAHGCYSDKTESLTIDQSPEANFNWDILNCDTTFFTDYSNDNGSNLVAWNWTFDDPSSGTANISFDQNPSHKFTAAGNYNVQLTVSNQHLCSDTLTQVVAYDAQPQSHFIFDTVCFGDSTHFTDITPVDFQSLQGWEWQFGDGVISHEQNPVHKYLAPGIYQVQLKVLNTHFCTDSILQDVWVHDLPVVNFSPDSSCFASEISFIDETNYNGTPNSWLWDFGDANTSTDQNPLHTYATEGSYQVSLTVTELAEGTAQGCSNTYTKAHYVNPLPTVDFTYDSVCLGAITQFTNLSTSPLGIESYSWDFDDGTTSTAASPTHTYTTFGSFDVKLIVTDFLGCVDSLTKTVNVYEIPLVSFDAPTVCLGDSTEFTDLTAPAANSWNWSFGDGTSSTLSNPKHLYNNAGTYSVLLEVEDIHGCNSSVVQEVEVMPLPIVDFSWNFAACAGDTVFFEDLSQGVNTDIANWNWNFGDNSSSTDQNPKHVYAQSNDTTYEVTLIVETATGCVDSLTQIVNITGAPQAQFSFSNNSDQGPCINNQFNFSDESTTQSGLIQSWHWDFGDGQTSNSQNPIHFYESSGTYTLSLTVSNTAGCENTYSEEIIVFDLPIIDFSFDSVCLGDSTHFNDSDQIDMLATAQWNYLFGDGATADISNPLHRYTTAGDYQVILQITDTNLCQNQITHQVPVFGLPAVNFTNDTACWNSPTHYTDLTQTADFELADWSWSFGDGTISSEQNPSHIFADFGNFATKLIVADEHGCTDSLIKNIQVYETPVAHFNWSDSSCTAGLIYFADSSYHHQGYAITDFLWTINGFETDIQNPQYNFPNTEVNYPISLAIKDARGCTDTTNQDIYIQSELEVSFTADSVCFGLPTQLIAYSTKPMGAEVSQWTWYFDDGSPILSTPNDTIYHVFTEDGFFRVELQGDQAESNCTAMAQKQVQVRKLPIAEFSAEAAACADSTFFQDESIASEGSIEQWRWYFGEGNSQTINSPDSPDTKYLYPPYLNSFDASLAITNEYGCVDSISHSVQRYPCIFVNFSTDTNIYCQSKQVIFIDSSIVDETATILSRYWDFGDGITSTLENPSHIYENTGIFTVTYVLNFDVNGTTLIDSMQKDITIYPTPIVAMLAENICDQEQAFLVSNTAANNSIIDSWTWTFGDGTDTTIISHEVNNTIYHRYPQAGAYDLELMAVTDLGCRDTASKNFMVNPLPQISFVADTNVLCGTGSILFTDSSQITSGSIVERHWDFGDGNTTTLSDPLIDSVSHEYAFASSGSASAAEYFTVTLSNTSDSNCVATDSVVEMISQYSLPIPMFTVEPDSTAITEIENITITNTSENAYYYEWELSDSLEWEDTFEPHVYEELQDTGRYKLQLFAQTVEGCWDSTTNYFKVYPVLRFFIPNAFSPNGNGLNETFGPKGKYFEDKTYHFRIFSRWGELMFETTNFYEQWDGRKLKDGSESPIGAYVWIIEIKDLQGNQEVFKGSVTLVK